MLDEIKMSTTDSVPGEDRVITRNEVAWASASTLKEAYAALKTWAREHEYDAVVGVRFTVRPDVYGSGRAGTVDIRTDARWIAYGTCISYRHAAELYAGLPRGTTSLHVYALSAPLKCALMPLSMRTARQHRPESARLAGF